MAVSPINQTSLHHFRSNSFPTRAHPLISEFNDQLSGLRYCEATSSSSTSLSQKLIGLQDLHDFNQKWFNELLDGSLRLLDVCGVARDALLQTKESTHELQSTLRRRHGSKIELAREVEKYSASRKVVKKALQKVLKGMQTKLNSKKNEDLTIVSLLKELEAVTVLVFESLLTFIAGSKLQSKSSGWFVVSKLVHPKRIVCEGEETNANDIEKVDAALQSLVSHKTSKCDYSIHVQNVQNWMGKLESSIQDVDEGLECLSRRLVKTRVSFLNILNH
ncbi:hypothetical protein RGQ29_018494 [Quercus rubra]|uniref:DUF241 domain protein n=1 Tax=Quercus rubra TaxID=3512 RepID=A0AAN7FL65_QUERU|nr:hypothetical protein RGQ29_018494 [Quercus rubra]